MLLGWIDSAQRDPRHGLLKHFLPFIASLEPWPASAVSKLQFLTKTLEAIEIQPRLKLLDRLVALLPFPLALDLVARNPTPPPAGEGRRLLALIDKAVFTGSAALTRPQARALAACIPPAEIQPRLEAISRLPSLTTATEEFAITLEFRKSMIAQLTNP